MSLSSNLENALNLRRDIGNVLWAQDSAPEEIRTNPDLVHVSTLVDWCARAYALSLKYLQHGARTWKPTGADRLVWAIGREVERHIRRSLIDGYGPENCFGRWRCRCGKSYYDNVYKPGMISACCDTPFNNYSEYVIENWTWRITGSMDFAIVENGIIVPIEIKSITDSDSGNKTNKGFSSLKKAIGSHATQLALYGVLLPDDKLPFPVADYGLNIYARKEYRFNSPYKYFELDLSKDSIYRTLADSLKRQAASVFDTSKLPTRICNTNESSRAKGCDQCQGCFTLPP